MKIIIVYPHQSAISASSPLVRQLFLDTIKGVVMRISENIAVSFTTVNHFKNDKDFEIHATPEALKMLPEISRCVTAVWVDAYKGIEKFECLLDVYGGKNPHSLFAATNFSEMGV